MLWLCQYTSDANRKSSTPRAPLTDFSNAEKEETPIYRLLKDELGYSLSNTILDCNAFLIPVLSPFSLPPLSVTSVRCIARLLPARTLLGQRCAVEQ